jgi:hypothetical protein
MRSEIRLPAGQALRFHAWTGARLRVRSGTALLALPPLWLAEHVYTPQRRLHCGETYLTESNGWYCLVAEAETALDLQAASPPLGFWPWPWHKFAELVLCVWRTGKRR